MEHGEALIAEPPREEGEGGRGGRGEGTCPRLPTAVTGNQGHRPCLRSNGHSLSLLSFSFAHTYNQTGLRVVLTSVMGGLTYLRGNRRFWSFLILRDWVSLGSGAAP